MIEEKKKPQVEILSPAGSYESFLAAIHAGADAVYAGGTESADGGVQNPKATF